VVASAVATGAVVNIDLPARPIPKAILWKAVSRWMGPVRPGDTLRIEGEIENLVPSKTKPQGTVVMKCTMYNQHGQAVYEFTPNTVVPRRPHN
jgi:acyl dehydratase